MGLPLFGPWTWIRQAHLAGLVKFHFYPLQHTNFLTIYENFKQCTKFIKNFSQFYIINLHNFSRNIINFLNLPDTYFKICTQICTYTHFFLKNVYTILFLQHTYFQRMYTIQYNQLTQFFKNCKQFSIFNI